MPHCSLVTDKIEYHNQKATMLIVNTMGFPVVRQVYLDESYKVGGTQPGTTFFYMPQHSRKAIGTNFGKSSSVTIAAGWHKINTPDEFYTFDNSLMDEMVKQLPEGTKIIFSNYQS